MATTSDDSTELQDAVSFVEHNTGATNFNQAVTWMSMTVTWKLLNNSFSFLDKDNMLVSTNTVFPPTQTDNTWLHQDQNMLEGDVISMAGIQHYTWTQS